MARITRLFFAGIVLLLASLSYGALAQSNRPATPPTVAPPSAPEQPERTTAQFGDWTLVCVGRPGQRQCEVMHTVQDAQRRSVAAIALGRIRRDMPMRMVLVVTANLSINVPARLVADGGEPFVLPFRRCMAGTCSAELELPDNALQRRIRSRGIETSASASWQDASGAEVTAALSLRGLLPALEALARESGS